MRFRKRTSPRRRYRDAGLDSVIRGIKKLKLAIKSRTLGTTLADKFEAAALSIEGSELSPKQKSVLSVSVKTVGVFAILASTFLQIKGALRQEETQFLKKVMANADKLKQVRVWTPELETLVIKAKAAAKSGNDAELKRLNKEIYGSLEGALTLKEHALTDELSALEILLLRRAKEKVAGKTDDACDAYAGLCELKEIISQHLAGGACFKSKCRMAVRFANDYRNGRYPNIACHALDRMACDLIAYGRIRDWNGVMRVWNKVEDILNRLYEKRQMFVEAVERNSF